MVTDPLRQTLFSLALVILASVSAESDAQDVGPTITIDVKLNLADNVQAWEVTWKATGLNPDLTDYALRIEDWGEWSRADSLFLRNLKSSIRIKKRKGATEYDLIPPENWDGNVQVEYRIMMMDGKSSARDSFGLMPWYMDSYGQGFTSNTLMDLFVSGSPIPAQRTITFHAESNHLIVSGWADSSRGTHVVQLDEPIGNTVVVFGNPVEIKKPNAGQTRLEVVQFGNAAPFLDEMAPKVLTVLNAFQKSTNMTPSNAKVIFTDTSGGGVNVDGAMIVGYEPGKVDSPNLLLTMAHELFHEWLGSGFVAVNNPEAVWFQEGFTDYLSLWHLAHSKLITPQQFVDRIWELNRELEKNPSRGTIAFADSSVNWRDGDGPNEQMAYKGSALLAFCTDVELRKAGHVGLTQIISDLAKLETGVGHAQIVSWYLANGLEEFSSRYISEPNFVDVTASLESIGCKQADLPCPIAYAGFKNDNDGQFGTVTAVDANGPAAKAGLRVGDRIRGFWPSVDRAFDIAEDRMPDHNYGINNFPLNETINFGVMRDGVEGEIKLQIKTTIVNDIATTKGYVADPEKVGVFLKR